MLYDAIKTQFNLTK